MRTDRAVELRKSAVAGLDLAIAGAVEHGWTKQQTENERRKALSQLPRATPARELAWLEGYWEARTDELRRWYHVYGGYWYVPAQVLVGRPQLQARVNLSRPALQANLKAGGQISTLHPKLFVSTTRARDDFCESVGLRADEFGPKGCIREKGWYWPECDDWDQPRPWYVNDKDPDCERPQEAFD